VVTVVKRDWLEVQALLKNEEFVQYCVDSDVDPAEALGVSGYTRADKCSHPIHLLGTNPETMDQVAIKVACDSNNSLMCAECADFKRRVRIAQMLGVLERPGNNVAFLTLTCPSFGKVHNSQFSKNEAYKIRHLDEAQQYRRRLTVMNSRKPCPCGARHTSEDALIGTPLGFYDYAGEVLWSANVPALMASAKESLKYWAKIAGIDISKGSEEFKIYAVYERQKKGSLHAHFLIVVNNNVKGFEKFVESIPDCDNLTPFPVSAKVPAKVSRGMSVGWDRYAAAVKDKRDFAAVMPARTRFGSVFDIRVLQPDAIEDDVEVDEDSVALIDELTVATDIKNPVSYARAAAYLAKYLSKNASSPFAPDALKEMSVEQRKHWAKFRLASVLLFTDRIVFDSIVSGMDKQISLARDAAVDVETGEVFGNLLNYLEELEAAREEFLTVGVTPSVVGDILAAKLVKHSLTVDVVADVVQSYLYKLRPFVGLVGEVPVADVPRRLLKMRLNRVANNAGFTGSMTSLHNWGFSLKDMKENRKAMFRALNPDVEDVEYIWELAPSVDGVAAVAIPARAEYVIVREVVKDTPEFAGDSVACKVGGVWWEKLLLDPAIFSAEDGKPYEWRRVLDY
jgi:hypothetical protein